MQRRLQSLINRGDSPLVQANVSHAEEFDLVSKAGMLGVASPERWREGLAVMENALRRALEHGFTQGELDEQLANVRTALRNAADQADTGPAPSSPMRSGTPGWARTCSSIQTTRWPGLKTLKIS